VGGKQRVESGGASEAKEVYEVGQLAPHAAERNVSKRVNTDSQFVKSATPGGLLRQILRKR